MAQFLGMKHLSLLTLILLMACQSKSNQTKSQYPATEKMQVMDSNINTQNDLLVVEGSIGLIVTSESYQFGDTIEVFGDGGKLARPIILTDENQELSLKCIGQDDSYYQVILDNNDIGFIPLHEKGILFQTWEEHVLSVFSVGFDEEKNPLREGPAENAESIYFDKDEFYHPYQIEGEWLRVRWGNPDNWEYAWVKWREGEKLLVELFYFA